MNYAYPCPMKVWSATDKDVIDAALNDENYGAQCKRDGASYVLCKDEWGEAHLYSGTISKKDGMPIDKIENCPHIKNFIEGFFPDASSLVAELWTKIDYASGTPHERELSSYTNTVMLCGADKAIERQRKYGPINCYVFDILEWGGEDFAKKDFAERDAKLEALFALTFPHNPWLSKPVTVVENKAQFLHDILSYGGEGIVLKLMRSTRVWSAKHPVVEIGQTPKRPAHTTLKIKQLDTVDVVIMGVELPNKEYTGKNPDTYPYRDENDQPVNRLWALDMINAFSVGLYDDNNNLVKIGTVASGLDDEIRKKAFDNPADYIGEVIECECMSIDKEAHTLRHPRMMQIRYDKPANQCLLKDMGW